MQLDIGSQVRTRDGHSVGRVKRIIFDADRMSVRQFVMRAGILIPSERIVDLERIDGIDDDHTVTIQALADAVDDLPAYVPAVSTPIYYNDMHSAHELGVIRRPGSIPADAVVLSHGTRVYDAAGEHIGYLDEIACGEGGRATAFVVDSGILFDREMVIPLSAVESVTHARIKLNVTVGEIERVQAA
jgi:uncharacterized protein YrrD